MNNPVVNAEREGWGMQGSFACLQIMFHSYFSLFALSTFCGTVANVMMCCVSDLVLLAKETISFGETSPQNTDIIYEGYKGTGSANVNKDGLGRG